MHQTYLIRGREHEDKLSKYTNCEKGVKECVTSLKGSFTIIEIEVSTLNDVNIVIF